MVTTDQHSDMWFLYRKVCVVMSKHKSLVMLEIISITRESVLSNQEFNYIKCFIFKVVTNN